MNYRVLMAVRVRKISREHDRVLKRFLKAACRHGVSRDDIDSILRHVLHFCRLYLRELAREATRAAQSKTEPWAEWELKRDNYASYLEAEYSKWSGDLENSVRSEFSGMAPIPEQIRNELYDEIRYLMSLADELTSTVYGLRQQIRQEALLPGSAFA